VYKSIYRYLLTYWQSIARKDSSPKCRIDWCDARLQVLLHSSVILVCQEVQRSFGTVRTRTWLRSAVARHTHA